VCLQTWSEGLGNDGKTREYRARLADSVVTGKYSMILHCMGMPEHTFGTSSA
jgi:hypothetical protein